MAEPEKVYILDMVTPKTGRAQAFLQHYVETYVPGAKARGMTLEHSLVAPPVWLENQPNVLFFLWSVAGVPGWWASQMQARVDDAVGDWWQDAAPMIASRRREFLGNVGDVARLTDV